MENALTLFAYVGTSYCVRHSTLQVCFLLQELLTLYNSEFNGYVCLYRDILPCTVENVMSMSASIGTSYLVQ